MKLTEVAVRGRIVAARSDFETRELGAFLLSLQTSHHASWQAVVPPKLETISDSLMPNLRALSEPAMV